MDRYLTHLALYFVLTFFLTACSTKNDIISSEKNNIISEEAINKEEAIKEEVIEKEELSPTILEFKKQKSGMQAVRSASPLLHEKNINYISDFINKDIEFSQYDLGKGNLIYVADLKNSLMFDYNKSNLRGSAKNSLNAFSKLYASGDFGKYLYIIGHTDSDGSSSYNYALSVKRALSVSDILLKNKVHAPNIHIVPAGEYLPKASNKTKKGKQINRRVEIISANSKALIQSYLRQLPCLPDEYCERKLLNIFSIRSTRTGNNINLIPLTSIATYSPDLNNLNALNKELRSDIQTADRKILKKNDRIALKEKGIDKRSFIISIDIRPVLELPKEERKSLYIPKKYIIKD